MSDKTEHFLRRLKAYKKHYGKSDDDWNLFEFSTWEDMCFEDFKRENEYDYNWNGILEEEFTKYVESIGEGK